MLDAELLVVGVIEAMTERAAQGGQLEVVRAQQVEEIAPARLGQVRRCQIADGIDLHAGNTKVIGFSQCLAQRQAK